MLEVLRKSEKKAVDTSSNATLGKLANWKNLSKYKRDANKNSSKPKETDKERISFKSLFKEGPKDKEANSDQFQSGLSSFKDAIDSANKLKNDSEVSFGLNNVNVQEL